MGYQGGKLADLVDAVQASTPGAAQEREDRTGRPDSASKTGLGISGGDLARVYADDPNFADVAELLQDEPAA